MWLDHHTQSGSSGYIHVATLFPSLYLLYFLWLTYTKSHNGYTLNHLIYFFLLNNSTAEKKIRTATISDHTHALRPSHTPHTTDQHTYTPLCSTITPSTPHDTHITRLGRLPSPDSWSAQKNSCPPAKYFFIGHTSPSYVPPLFFPEGCRATTCGLAAHRVSRGTGVTLQY